MSATYIPAKDPEADEQSKETMMQYTIKEADVQDKVDMDIYPKMMEFFKKYQHPSESDVQTFAQDNGFDLDKVKDQIYLALGFFLGYGRANEKGIEEKDVDPKQLEMGIKVEMEHTACPLISQRISLDHLAELDDYYTRLDEMESNAGVYNEAVNVVKGLAKKSDKSEAEIEVLWGKAKKIVDKEYPEIPKGSEQYFKVLTGVTKKMSGISEGKRTSISKSTRAHKIKRATGQLATIEARKRGDSIYKQMIRYRDLYYKYRTMVHKKYKSRVRSKARR